MPPPPCPAGAAPPHSLGWPQRLLPAALPTGIPACPPTSPLLATNPTPLLHSLMLMLNNVYALLDQLSALLGTTGSPPLLAVAIVLCSLLFVNSIMYVALSHVLYAIMLRGMGLELHGAPKSLERFIAGLPTT